MNPRDIPPRELPPMDWDIGKQMISRQKWVEMQGGRQVPASDDEVSADDYLGGICPDCSDVNLESKPYRRHFDPPLKNVDPETVPADDLQEHIESYRKRFMENGDFIDRCDHLSDRECLRWIVELTNRELEVRGAGGSGIFQLTLECPDCLRRVENENEDSDAEALIEQAEEQFEQTETRIRGLREAQSEQELSVSFPPGSRRLRLLTEATFERLKTDVETNEIDLFHKDIPTQTVRDVLDGVRALQWIVGGMLQFYSEERKRSRNTLLGGARMVRIMNQRDPDRHPGRLYGDLEVLLPDVNQVCFTIERADDPDTVPDFPDSPDDTPSQWRDLYAEEITHNHPPFAELIPNEATEERVKRAHENWKSRIQYKDVREEKASRLLRDFIGRKTQFDPESPEAFLDKDVRPVDPADVEPEQFSNQALVMFFIGDDSKLTNETLDVIQEEDNREDSREVKIRREPLRENPYDLRPLLETARDQYRSTDADEAGAAAVNVVYHLLQFANESLEMAYDYRRTVDHREPVDGAVIFVEDMLRKATRIINDSSVAFDELAADIHSQLE